MNKEKCNLLRRLLGQIPKEIAKITIQYSGSGDSGGIDPPYSEDKLGNKVDLPEKMGNQISEIIDEELGRAYGGWYNDDGASGDYVIDVKTNEIFHTHNEFYQEVNTTENKIEF